MNAGSYTIAPSGLSANNYAISYVDGTLTVRPDTGTSNGLGDLLSYSNSFTGGANNLPDKSAIALQSAISSAQLAANALSLQTCAETSQGHTASAGCSSNLALTLSNDGVKLSAVENEKFK